MTQDIDIAGLADVARGLLAGGGRQIMAIAGAPRSGKSTMVDRLAEMLGAGDAVAILPMDGFHFDDAVLHQLGRRPWKGAPDTFDVGGLRMTLERLRGDAEDPVAVPVFDRDLEISRGSARLIGGAARLILVEGNYLLLDRAPWSDLAPLFDVTVMIDVPEEELRRRLRGRWEGYGLTEEEIGFKLDENDLPNGRAVIHGSIAPDYLCR
ncbi:nucleoside/nucleotide kinase family protein [Pseudoprimorskyibacter insulae]|uniref:Uridine kinase n=1 Tax=Pseudoprimorskyibacter insulae TaxID=1695997 RepID=A0A2R8AWK8_9RHOB|nr:nucleoside/nucleotide kinase family protein [Pseudoprimorskyibacter insulae]SPF80420.1 Uridine kinase [Pseudoprimorskyibacter insulae]